MQVKQEYFFDTSVFANNKLCPNLFIGVFWGGRNGRFPHELFVFEIVLIGIGQVT